MGSRPAGFGVWLACGGLASDIWAGKMGPSGAVRRLGGGNCEAVKLSCCSADSADDCSSFVSEHSVACVAV